MKVLGAAIFLLLALIFLLKGDFNKIHYEDFSVIFPLAETQLIETPSSYKTENGIIEITLVRSVAGSPVNKELLVTWRNFRSQSETHEARKRELINVLRFMVLRD